MMYYIDEDGYQKIIDYVGQVSDNFKSVNDRLNRDDYQEFEVFKDTGCFYGFHQAMIRQNQRVLKLQDALKKVLADWKENKERAEGEIGTIESESSYTASFGEYYNNSGSKDYSGSIAAAFVYNGQSFTNDYNDIYRFMNTDEYKQAEQWLANSEINDYWQYVANYGGNNSYGEELLELSLSQMLQTLPGVDTEIDNILGDAGSLFSLIDSYWGVNSQELYDQLKGWYEKLCGGDQETIEAIASGNFEEIGWVRTLLESVDDEDQWIVKKCLELIFNEDTASFFTDVDNAGKFVQLLKENFDLMAIALTNYKQQKDYLTTMKEALLTAGYSGGSVINKIKSMEKTYSENYLVALNEVKNDLKKYGAKAVKKEILKKLPVLKSVDLVLSGTSSYAKLFHGTEIKAAKEILACSQMDRALSKSFNIYAERIKNGLADSKDLEEANKLFFVVKGMKIREYESMISLVEKGSEAYQTYADKLNQLKQMNSVTDFTNMQ